MTTAATLQADLIESVIQRLQVLIFALEAIHREPASPANGTRILEVQKQLQQIATQVRALGAVEREGA